MKIVSTLLTCILLGAGKVYSQPQELPEVTAETAYHAIATSPSQILELQRWVKSVFGGDDTVKQTNGFILGAQDSPPFSFVYGGVASSNVLMSWKRTIQVRDADAWSEYQVIWRDPQTSLSVKAVVKGYKRCPAVEWVLWFENQGTVDTPILENIEAADLRLVTDADTNQAILHGLKGDSANEDSFAPVNTVLFEKGTLQLSPTGGRSSSISAFPFFNLQQGQQGVVCAVGWSGQWAASFDRHESGHTHFKAGMERTHLLLHPGERIRTPRILLMPWKGDLQASQNEFRRLMLSQYVPKNGNRPVSMPTALQCYDRYSTSDTNWATERGQLAAASAAHAMGMDTLWFDAAWFPGGFPDGVGNWFPKPKDFPNGLKPISDKCHSLGMKFILWFEPERVGAGSRIAIEHPEYVFGGAKGGLFKLNDPTARRFLTDLLSREIKESGLDIYRNDFNIDPLSYWQGNDTPNRQGITEINYIAGLYTMWDELLRDHPGLLIDNCASGGRRIDLETCLRSVPLWRSDAGCGPGHPDWNQVQSMGISQYIPLDTACVWTPNTYDVRSAATAGIVCEFDYRRKDFPGDVAKASVAEVAEDRKYWYGDFYPLSEARTDPDKLNVYQLNRPDLEAGMVLAFRHAQCKSARAIAPLRGLTGNSDYSVDFIDEDRHTTTEIFSGEDLMRGLELKLDKPGTSLLVRYHRLNGQRHQSQDDQI